VTFDISEVKDYRIEYLTRLRSNSGWTTFAP